MSTSNNKTVILEKMIGKLAKGDKGEHIYSAFQKDTPLHIKQDNHSLWYMQYDPPAQLPESLKHKFTNVNKLLSFLEVYYSKRNIRIKEVLNDGV